VYGDIMDLSSINVEIVTKLLLLLLIGLGPKIALVPFLDKTKGMSPEEQRAIGRLMVRTAVVTALVIFATGALLMRLLHITSGAIAVAGGMILALLAVRMASGPGEAVVEKDHMVPDGKRTAVYPLAVPYLLNPVGLTVLIMASGEVVSVAGAALVVGLVLLVGAFDYLVFTNMDRLASRLSPANLVVSEVVFGVLLTAVAVQLMVFGLQSLGLIEAVARH
jgi:multiple antibiotic resistance protein